MTLRTQLTVPDILRNLNPDLDSVRNSCDVSFTQKEKCTVDIFSRQIVDSRSGANQNTALKSVRVILMLEAWYSFVFRKKREAFTCSAQRLTQFDESVHVFVSRRVRTFLYNSFSNQLLSLAAGRRVLPSRWVSEAQTFHTFSNISSFFISEKRQLGNSKSGLKNLFGCASIC